MTKNIVQAKAWWTSKLVWLGVGELLIGLAEVVSTTPILEGSEIAGYATSFAGLLTIGLRFVTEKPIASTTKPVTVEEK